METQELQHKRSFNPAAAYLDAVSRSATAQSTYSSRQQIAAERMKLAIELVYDKPEVFVTYRKKFIAVKVSKCNERNVKELRLLEKEWAVAGVTRHVSPQGVIYRIPKNG